MADVGATETAEEIMQVLWKIIILVIVAFYINFYLLSYINIVDETGEVVGDAFVSRAKYCKEQSLELINCFQNFQGNYGLKVDNEIVGDQEFNDFNMKHCPKNKVCQTRTFYVNGGKHTFEVIFHG